MCSVSANYFSFGDVFNIAKQNGMELEPFVIETLKEMADENGVIKRFQLIRQDATEMKFSLDVSSLDSLRFQYDSTQERLGINNLTIAALVTLFDAVAQEAAKKRMTETGDKVRGCVASLDLSRNMISGKSLLWFKCMANKENKTITMNTRVSFPILSNIEELRMNQTLVSSLGLKFACLLTKLKSLSLDFCPRVDSVLNPDVSSIPTLENLSIIGTKMSIGFEEMYGLAVKFPHLTTLEYSQKPSSTEAPQKVLGITDPITFSTVIDPVLFECGHLTGRKEASQLEKCYSNCESKMKGEFKPLLTRLVKQDKHWQVKLIDFKRRDLTGSIFYHEQCGTLFNHETVKEIFQLFESKESARSIEASPLCPACIANPLTGTPIPLELVKVYPELTPLNVEERSQSMQTLQQQSVYIHC